MTSFDVTPSDLSALASSLGALLANLESAAAGIVSADPGAAQNPELSGAIEGFVTEWASGLRESQDKLQALSSRLAQAGTHYQGVDESVAAGM